MAMSIIDPYWTVRFCPAVGNCQEVQKQSGTKVRLTCCKLLTRCRNVSLCLYRGRARGYSMSLSITGLKKPKLIRRERRITGADSCRLWAGMAQDRGQSGP